MESSWKIPENEKTDLVFSILELGYSLIKNGVNRFKTFIFYLPDIYALISNKNSLTDVQQVI